MGTKVLGYSQELPTEINYTMKNPGFFQQVLVETSE